MVTVTGTGLSTSRATLGTSTMTGAGSISKNFSIKYSALDGCTFAWVNPLSGTTNAFAATGSSLSPAYTLKYSGATLPASAYTAVYSGERTHETINGGKLDFAMAGNLWVDSAEFPTQNFSIVEPPEITTSSATFRDMFPGRAYNRTFRANGTNSASYPMTWSITENNLPDGLSLSSDGTLSGTVDPAAIDQYSATIKAENLAGSGSVTYTWQLCEVGGRVVDGDGNGVAGVSVVSQQGDGISAVTGADGSYGLKGFTAQSIESADIVFTMPSSWREKTTKENTYTVHLDSLAGGVAMADVVAQKSVTVTLSVEGTPLTLDDMLKLQRRTHEPFNAR